ncbi:hypothetical protein DMN91_011859 [Ooceraea biroi]|uniref:Fibronectin type-III domain-containing protein n=1 Tax=Ooceraea biroi TaxID=2015173 RepID=A0A3L8D797_OOCBI|nr:hypothetical protein DMN91_011859 [Ooceraea biroi]
METQADVPDPPERPLVISYTSKAVNISWAPGVNSHNTPISQYVIYTRIDEDGPWNATKEIITPHNDTFYTVENLRPFTVYSFRVAAINALGRSKPSQASYYMVTLREIPEGKPTITAAHNTSASSIYLAWKPPSRDTIHGEFLGYRIGYRRREKADEEMKNIYIRDPGVDNHSIHNLDTFTQYLVSLQVFNPEGHGPASTVTVMTDEGCK